MGNIPAPSPIGFGPNYAQNQENGILSSNGTLLNYNGPKNYITNGNFENGLTTGWSVVGIASLTNGLPVSVGTSGAAFSTGNGGRTAGASTLTPAVVLSGQLSGIASLNLATNAAGTIGDGYVSQVYNIDLSDQAKVLNISFNYKVVTGTPNLSGTSSNTYACAVYDLVNNQWLGVTSAFNLVQGTGVGLYTGAVQTLSTTVGIQLFIYSPVAPTAASSLFLDSFTLGPQFIATGYAGTDWVSYTPTITGFGTVTAVAFWSRRLGDSLEVQGDFTTGTPTAVPNGITLGYGGANANVTLDFTKMVGGASSTLVGDATISAASTTFFRLTAMASSTVWTNAIGLAAQTSTSGSNSIQNGSAIAGASQVIYAHFKVPISGWSSNTVQSSDSLQTIVDLIVSSTTTSTGSTTQPFLFQSVTKDSVGNFNISTGQYKIPVSGDYQVSISGASSTGAASLGVYINGVVYLGPIVTFNATADSGASILVAGLKANDLIDIRPNGSLTITSGCTFSAFRLSGPAVVQASDRVAMRAFSSSTTVSASLATVVYGSKQFDITNSYSTSTGIWTCPSTNYYQANACVAVSGTIALNNTLDIQIQQTGSATQIAENTEYAGGLQTALVANVGDVFYCLQGDTLKVQVSSTITTPVIVSSTSKNWFSIAKVGGN